MLCMRVCLLRDTCIGGMWSLCESPMHISFRMRPQRRGARGRVGGTSSDTCVHCLGRASCFLLAACLPRHAYVTQAPACKIWGRLRAWLTRERAARPGGSGGKSGLSHEWRASVRSVRPRKSPRVTMHAYDRCLPVAGHYAPSALQQSQLPGRSRCAYGVGSRRATVPQVEVPVP